MVLDMVLRVDKEDRNAIYTEVVCDKNGKCWLSSRKGYGSSRPNVIVIKGMKKNTATRISRDQ